MLFTRHFHAVGFAFYGVFWSPTSVIAVHTPGHLQVISIHHQEVIVSVPSINLSETLSWVWSRLKEWGC